MLEQLEKITKRFDELTQLLADPEVAQDYERTAEYAKERADLEEIVGIYHTYLRATKELDETRTLLSDETDPELHEMAEAEVARLSEQVDALGSQLHTMLLPKDSRDSRNVIVEVRAGAGGDEAGLFAANLYRMYTRYAERQGWKTELLSSHSTGIGGFKEVIFGIRGRSAFSRLKYESGVHRVQRVPTTEAAGRIHTSTATVAVLPEVDEVEVHIDPKDLQIDTYGSSGPGGQHMQKNATAIRITHLPTGMVVSCENERSQTQNRMQAMAILRARLYEHERARQHAEIADARRAQVGSGERSEKIRTYNYPQSRVTDHRIGLSSYRLADVIDGDLDAFINELRQEEQNRRLQAISAEDKA